MAQLNARHVDSATIVGLANVRCGTQRILLVRFSLKFLTKNDSLPTFQQINDFGAGHTVHCFCCFIEHRRWHCRFENDQRTNHDNWLCATLAEAVPFQEAGSQQFWPAPISSWDFPTVVIASEFVMGLFHSSVKFCIQVERFSRRSSPVTEIESHALLNSRKPTQNQEKETNCFSQKFVQSLDDWHNTICLISSDTFSWSHSLAHSYYVFVKFHEIFY